jgi:hypothetical protein
MWVKGEQNGTQTSLSSARNRFTDEIAVTAVYTIEKTYR